MRCIFFTNPFFYSLCLSVTSLSNFLFHIFFLVLISVELQFYYRVRHSSNMFGVTILFSQLEFDYFYRITSIVTVQLFLECRSPWKDHIHRPQSKYFGRPSSSCWTWTRELLCVEIHGYICTIWTDSHESWGRMENQDKEICSDNVPSIYNSLT